MSSTPVGANRAPKVILTIILWLLSAGLGLVAVYYIHELSIVGYAFYLTQTNSRVSISENSTGVLIGQTMALIGGAAWLVAIIGLGEYQFKHAGEPRSWKLFGWVLGIELIIILAGLLLT